MQAPGAVDGYGSFVFEQGAAARAHAHVRPLPGGVGNGALLESSAGGAPRRSGGDDRDGRRADGHCGSDHRAGGLAGNDLDMLQRSCGFDDDTSQVVGTGGVSAGDDGDHDRGCLDDGDHDLGCLGTELCESDGRGGRGSGVPGGGVSLLGSGASSSGSGNTEPLHASASSTGGVHMAKPDGDALMLLVGGHDDGRAGAAWGGVGAATASGGDMHLQRDGSHLQREGSHLHGDGSQHDEFWMPPPPSLPRLDPQLQQQGHQHCHNQQQQQQQRQVGSGGGGGAACAPEGVPPAPLGERRLPGANGVGGVDGSGMATALLRASVLGLAPSQASGRMHAHGKWAPPQASGRMHARDGCFAGYGASWGVYVGRRAEVQWSG